MAESLKTILMSALTAKATPAETDTMIVGEGNVLKKITFSQLFTYLKDKLGINTLNTKIETNLVNGLSGSYMDLGTTFCTYSEKFLYLHLGFSCSTNLVQDTVIAYLPKQVETVRNIGILGVNQGSGIISALTVYNNVVVVAGTISPGAYFADLVLKVK